ncbi:6586_t:CDS:1 [Paraglomus occultum]|uniref:6586_t:CDS:1 n=1 Tax=Paraglomus occultum TaxID=144539 RepID=A0A9N9DVE7_9GLOM|nr:6586_t:CDS:1 [Paraglomus occultum]
MSRYEVLQNVDEDGRQLEVEDVEHEFKTPRIKVGSVNLEKRNHNKLGKAASKIAELGIPRKNTESCCLQKKTTTVWKHYDQAKSPYTFSLVSVYQKETRALKLQDDKIRSIATRQIQQNYHFPHFQSR